jgi:hypothetical protein
MKLGIVTLWTNGREEALLRNRRVPTAAPAVEPVDVLSAGAKPLFAVDDIAVAIERLVALRSASLHREAIGSVQPARKPKSGPRPKRRVAKAASRSRARGAV